MMTRPARLFFLCLCCVACAFPVAAAELDPSFGHDGRVAIELGLGTRANAVKVQPDGKVVGAGFSTSSVDRNFMLFRLLPDGTPDPAFNGDGTVTTAVGSFDDEALTLALQPDGKILAAGYSINKASNRDFAVARYENDGTLDDTFGNNGIVITAVGINHEEITDIALQPDGGIILTGSAQTSTGKVVVLGRYLANGTLDTSFANNGFSLNAVGLNAQAESVVLTNDYIVVSGSYSDSTRTGLMLLGFNKDGLLDSSFAGSGIATPADTTVFNEGYGMFVNADNTILVAGSVGEEEERDAALFQFTADGYPISTFGINGTVMIPTSLQDDVLYDVVVTGGMIAATGFKTVDDGREFLLVTYNQAGGSVQESTGDFKASVVTTEYSDGTDTSTAVAAVSSNTVVVVGESKTDDETSSSAAISQYTTTDFSTANTLNTTNIIEATAATGFPYILTGEPQNVTRTTAEIFVSIYDGLGSSITERGIVFSTLPYPTMDLDDASTDDDTTDDDTTDDDDDDTSDDTTAPSIIED
ncbi:MAG: hypothetical protein D3923_10595, partial [Candidatus Electrothrix sp. AR3]|nr:hypothetical protein [Candidatus Electrothrix sp. AR3]